jgi:hypothetical protein
MIIVDREKLQQLSTWMGFVGIITIIGGILTAITIVGLIPGVITTILGVKLRNAKQYADVMLAEHEGETYSGSFNLFVDNLNTYFKIQGILIILSFVFVLIAILVSLIAGVFAYTGRFF